MIPFDVYAMLHVHCPLTLEVNHAKVEEDGNGIEAVTPAIVKMPGYYCFRFIIGYN